MSRLSISLGQMRIQLGRVEDNLETAERLIAGASERGSNLVMLPELWSTGYDLENALDYADALGEGHVRADVNTFAKSWHRHLWLDPGTEKWQSHELRRLA